MKLWRKPKTFICCAYPKLEIDEARIEVIKAAAPESQSRTGQFCNFAELACLPKRDAFLKPQDVDPAHRSTTLNSKPTSNMATSPQEQTKAV
jgi:hypothetical protein